jgi:Mg-chelatase subunit ChlI
VPNLEIRPAADVRAWVLATAGARPTDRDAVDARIIQEVRDRTGTIPSSQEDVGGWPELVENHRELTLPARPDGDGDGDGYTHLEAWLHGFSQQVESEISRQAKGTSRECTFRGLLAEWSESVYIYAFDK